MSDKIIIGLVEEVEIGSNERKKVVAAKVDTGATKSSIDINLASELRLGPVIKSKLVKSAHGNKLRPVVEAHVKIKGKELVAEFTLADRSHLKYAALIGVNILKEGFMVDPS